MARRYKNNMVQAKKLTGVLMTLAGLAVGVFLVKTGINLISRAGETTFKVGSIGGKTIYRRTMRTGWDYMVQPWDAWNMTENASPLYGRAAKPAQAVYDPKALKTYMYYPGGIINLDGTDYSAYEPYVLAYNHPTNSWEGPYKLFSSGAIDDRFALTDNHKYPQLVVDKDGYIHVFYTWHGTPRNILHYTSVRPGDVSDWTMSEIPKTYGSTYGTVFKDNQNEIYIFYRQNLGMWDPNYVWTNGDVSKCSPYCFWYERQVFVKSADNGKNWSAPRAAVDPGSPGLVPSSAATLYLTGYGLDYVSITATNPSGWNTVYVKDLEQDFKNNRLYFTFTVNQYHNVSTGKTNVAMFDFGADMFRAVDGSGSYFTLTRDLYNWEKLTLNPGPTVTNANLSVGDSQAIILDVVNTSKIPDVYLVMNCVNATEKCPLMRATWANGKYVLSLAMSEWVDSLWDGRMNSNGSVDLVMKLRKESDGTIYPAPNFSSWPVQYKYSYRTKWFNNLGGTWQSLPVFADNLSWENRGLSHFAFLDGTTNPQIVATAVRPAYTESLYTIGAGSEGGINRNYPIGVHYAFGEGLITPAEPRMNANITNACKSFVSLSINDCDLTEWGSKPKNPACIVSQSGVWMKNIMPGATKVRYIEPANSALNCTEPLVVNDPGWTAWEDVSVYRYWKLRDGAGDKKVCVQYKNHDYQSNTCGAIVTRI